LAKLNPVTVTDVPPVVGPFTTLLAESTGASNENPSNNVPATAATDTTNVVAADLIGFVRHAADVPEVHVLVPHTTFVM
jgi:hypothetical protein